MLRMKTPIETPYNFNTAVLTFLSEEVFLYKRILTTFKAKEFVVAISTTVIHVPVPVYKHHAMEMYGRTGKEKNLFPVPEIESRLSSPAASVKYITTDDETVSRNEKRTGELKD
jgi:hypothetical protein